ncbi:MAG: hydroxyethylthiazole kinase [archaeon]|nr:hydroxyethylthiazole kinase [archaeon]
MENKIDITENSKIALKNLKTKNPLTHCITNAVTVNDCANAVLAIGGSPIMAYNEEEVEEIVNIASSLVINIGNPSKDEVKSIKKACQHASKINKPILFDPVGVGISKLRNDLSIDLIKNSNITVIRGNMSEIKAIAKLIKPEILESNSSSSGKGVDVAESDIITKDNLKVNGLIVKKLAEELNTIIITSGPIDIISDGDKLYAVENGDDIMPLITGSGCMLSAIIGAYIGANEPLVGGIIASLHMTIAGENAAKYVRENNLGTGTFRQRLIDNLYLITEDEIAKRGNLYEIEIQ